MDNPEPSARPATGDEHLRAPGRSASAAIELPDLDALAALAAEVDGDLDRSLRLARDLGSVCPAPGEGRTADLWAVLATVAAGDLTAARVLEPHLDALAILSQAVDAPAPDPTRLWGVYAAEGPPPHLRATEAGGSWSLTGRKHWCSLADRADRALVTAWVDDDRRGLFAVDLADASPTADQRWVARGLSAVTSLAVDFESAPAIPVGAPGWYLERPGFAWGGIGVAAVWYGGAVGVARRLRLHRDGNVDQIGQMHLGAVEAALHAAGCTLRDAADEVDHGAAEGAAGAALALRVRQVVRRAAEEVLTRSAHAMGPGPLAQEEVHARRVADLDLYLRQEHAERDQAALGVAVLDEPRTAGLGVPL